METARRASLPVRSAGLACWPTQPLWNPALTAPKKQQHLQHADKPHLFRLFWTSWWHQSQGTPFLWIPNFRMSFQCQAAGQWELIPLRAPPPHHHHHCSSFLPAAAVSPPVLRRKGTYTAQRTALPPQVHGQGEELPFLLLPAKVRARTP